MDVQQDAISDTKINILFSAIETKTLQCKLNPTEHNSAQCTCASAGVYKHINM